MQTAQAGRAFVFRGSLSEFKTFMQSAKLEECAGCSAVRFLRDGICSECRAVDMEADDDFRCIDCGDSIGWGDGARCESCADGDDGTYVDGYMGRTIPCKEMERAEA